MILYRAKTIVNMSNPEMGDEMIDLRYHIATVAALFLALGLGIFIGSTVISDGILIKEQEQLIVRLEKEFDKLRDDNRSLKANVTSLQESLNAYDELGKEIFPILAQNKLARKSIGLIITNPDFNPEGFIEVLMEAGVEKVHQVRIAKEFFLQDQSENLVPDIITIIAGFLVTPGQEKVTEEPAGSKFISGSFTSPVDYLLIIGGQKINTGLDYAKLLDLPLAKELMKLEIPIIGVQPKDVEFSYIPTYKALGIPTVEDLDTFTGKVKLIQLLEQ
jgi:hypothetical protein